MNSLTWIDFRCNINIYGYDICLWWHAHSRNKRHLAICGRPHKESCGADVAHSNTNHNIFLTFPCRMWIIDHCTRPTITQRVVFMGAPTLPLYFRHSPHRIHLVDLSDSVARGSKVANDCGHAVGVACTSFVSFETK